MPSVTQDPGHPHTNMAKAVLNMLTGTSAAAAEMLEQDGSEGVLSFAGYLFLLPPGRGGGGGLAFVVGANLPPFFGS